MGTHPLYALAITVYRMAERPWILGGLLIGVGYFGSWLRGLPRYDDPAFRKYLGTYQKNKLFGRNRSMA